MAGRRREARFVAATAWSGALQTIEEVVTERLADGEIWVWCVAPVAREELLTLELATQEGLATFEVRVADCEPLVVSGQLKHRVRLDVLHRSNGHAAAGGTDADAEAEERA
jgi:hypothetical protein